MFWGPRFKGRAFKFDRFNIEIRIRRVFYINRLGLSFRILNFLFLRLGEFVIGVFDAYNEAREFSLASDGKMMVVA